MRRRLLTICAVMLTVLGMAAPASAASAADLPLRETGVVDKVNDGDTFRFIPDSQTAWQSVRIIGINAPEVAGFQNKLHPRDFCGGPQAYRQLQQLLPKGTRIELRSLDPASMNRGRLQRSVFALSPATGQYDIDIAAELARSGWVTWFTLEREATFSADYRRLVDAAQNNQIGIWNPGNCGSIEQDGARITLSIHWDAPGNDAGNLNGEYVIVRNAGTTTVDISNWTLRDSALDSQLAFPQGSVLAPGDYRVVHAGSGTPGSPNPRDLYIGSPIAIFPNLQPGKFLGDSAYLLDTSTAYRAWAEYPCLDDCSADPLQNQLRISRVNRTTSGSTPNQRANSQTVTLLNRTGHAVLLDDAYLRHGLSTFSFAPGIVLKTHASITVHMGKGRPTAKDQYWGLSAPLLSVRGGAIDLRSTRDALISRLAWGDRSR